MIGCTPERHFEGGAAIAEVYTAKNNNTEIYMFDVEEV